MYVVCLLFYAIGRFLYLFLFVLLIAEFYQQFVSEVFIAETMHICYSVTDQVVRRRIIELAQCLFVRKPCLLRKEFYDASILHLQYGWISLHSYSLWDDLK